MSGSSTSLINKSCSLFSSSTLQVEEKVSPNIISILGFTERVECEKVDKNEKQDSVWGMIMSQKKSVEVELPPPYVHPLLRKSNSSLSEKSLELCTENLGSETGSDGFSSYPPSEAGTDTLDFSKQEESRKEVIKNYMEEELLVPKCNNPAAFGKKMMQPRSFPPPLSSLTRTNNDGSSVYMHSQRANGRLVVQAVAVPSTKNFQAQRQDGRLRLTLFNTTPNDKLELGEQHQVLDQEVTSNQKGNKLIEEEVEEMSDILKNEDDDDVEIDDDNDDDDDNEDYDEEEEMCSEDKKQEVRSESINVQKSGFMIKKKLMGIENLNSHTLNYIVKPLEFEAMNEEITVLPQFLPPRPRITRLMPATSGAANEETTLMLLQSLQIATPLMPAISITATATVFNSYEYSWREKSATGVLKKQLINRHSSPLGNKITNGANEPQKKESVTLRNCQETRSLLSWEPYCFAT